MHENTDLLKSRYIVLETYRKNNQPVRTPVWLVVLNDTIHVITREKTGKVKRIRNNPSVKIAPCTFRGKPTGPWISGTARFASKEESDEALRLRKAKYGILDTIARLISGKKGDLVVFSISLG